MRRRGIQYLRQTPSWLKTSLGSSRRVNHNTISHDRRVQPPSGAGACGFKVDAHMRMLGFCNRDENATRGNASLAPRPCLGSLVSSWTSIRLLSSVSEGEGEGEGKSNGNGYGDNSGGHGGSHSESSHDEIVGRFENLLQKWSSNTPLLLDALQVQLTPAIVCGVLKKIPKSDAARKFFNWAKTQRLYEHNEYTYTALIDHYGWSNNFSAAEQVAAEMREAGCAPSAVTFTSLLRWARQVPGGSLAGVRRVWQHMRDAGCRPNEYTYTTYIDTLAKGGHHQEALEAFEAMQASGCRPNVFTYTVVIHSLVEAGKLDAAMELFKSLAELQHRPSAATYAVLVRAHRKAGDLDRAVDVYKRMMEGGWTPSQSLRSYLSAALTAAGRAGEAATLTEISTAMAAAEIAARKAAADAAALRGSLPRPEKLAELLRDWGPETEHALARVKVKLRHPYLLNVLTLVGKEPEVAWRFFEWVKAQEGYNPTRYMFTKMMDIIGKAGHMELQREVLEEVGTATEANALSFNMLIKSYCETKHTDAALQVFERMKEQGFEPNAHTFTMLIDLLSRTRSHADAMKMYAQMRKAKCKPTVQTYTAILHSLARSGRVDAARILFEKLPSLGIAPSAATYTSMLQAFLKAQDLEQALKLYDAMGADGITLTGATFKMLTRALHTAGRHEEADSLLHAEPCFPDPEPAAVSQRPTRAQKEARARVSKHFA